MGPTGGFTSVDDLAFAPVDADDKAAVEEEVAAADTGVSAEEATGLGNRAEGSAGGSTDSALKTCGS